MTAKEQSAAFKLLPKLGHCTQKINDVKMMMEDDADVDNEQVGATWM